VDSVRTGGKKGGGVTAGERLCEGNQLLDGNHLWKKEKEATGALEGGINNLSHTKKRKKEEIGGPETSTRRRRFRFGPRWVQEGENFISNENRIGSAQEDFTS